MNQKLRQEKKKKAREKKSKEKVLKRREVLRKQKREERAEEKDRRYYEVKGQTFRKEPAVTPQTQVRDPSKVKEVKARLEHNMEILKALEAEYDQEQEMRKKTHDKLEADGATTLREKMDLIAETATEEVGKEGAENVD